MFTLIIVFVTSQLCCSMTTVVKKTISSQINDTLYLYLSIFSLYFSLTMKVQHEFYESG